MEDDRLLSSLKAGVTVSIIVLSSLDRCLAEVTIPCRSSLLQTQPVAPSLLPAHRRMLFHRGNCRNKVPQNGLRQLHDQFLLQEAGIWKHEGEGRFFPLFLCRFICHPPLLCQDHVWLKAGCWQFFSSWLITTDNLNLVNENDENLEVVYSISNMRSDRKAKSAEPKNGLWKIIQMLLLDTLAQVPVNSWGILLVIYLSMNKTTK